MKKIQIMLDNSPEMIKKKSAQFNYDFWQLRTPLTCYRLANVPYGLDVLRVINDDKDQMELNI